MNSDFNFGSKARDWLREACDSWAGDGMWEPAALEMPEFKVGDLLSAGGGVAVITGMNEGPYGWRYDVLRGGHMWQVDEHALLQWRVISKM